MVLGAQFLLRSKIFKCMLRTTTLSAVCINELEIEEKVSYTSETESHVCERSGAIGTKSTTNPNSFSLFSVASSLTNF